MRQKLQSQERSADHAGGEPAINIGQRLRSLRKAKGLSLGDVQERTGIFVSHLSRIETGRIVPNLDTLQRWAWALHAEVYEFFLDDGQIPPGVLKGDRKPAHFPGSREERLLDLFRCMDARNRDLILSLAELVGRHLRKRGNAPVGKAGPRLTASAASARMGNRTLHKQGGRSTKALHDAAEAADDAWGDKTRADI